LTVLVVLTAYAVVSATTATTASAADTLLSQGPPGHRLVDRERRHAGLGRRRW
jgi:hypothetical protein